MVRSILQEYKIHNAHVNFRGDYDVDELIDVIEGNRKYAKCLYVYNKIDTISIEEVEALTNEETNVAISVTMKLGLDIMKEKIWDLLGLVRVYTKRKGMPPDFSDPLILTHGRHGCQVKSAILQIHKGLLKDFSYAMVWGRSVKYSP
mmetsp:Transcript_11628/g.8491  ORF Transcript_11628/g.8491 Transcript_11628/m.8491 type:complete len:147 (-) Transcript_11628:101-541(-)